jgi:hypothetical protein
MMLPCLGYQRSVCIDVCFKRTKLNGALKTGKLSREEKFSTGCGSYPQKHELHLDFAGIRNISLWMKCENVLEEEL